MNSKKILIVDDDVAILNSLQVLLDFEGFEVVAFESGSQVFKWVENRSVPDAILLDMWLPDEDGREICKRLKKLEPTKNVPIIIMSASHELEKTAIESGANAFLAKPFEIEDFLGTLQRFTE
ncbi:PleD family two-component system response regulator [Chryseobacterium sp. R2A-55]|uniref:response regulator n=1 Tax=Chryseobacterium sp. R2A-55 TaxID=2744445 RepID=UPI001F432D60|nr:response regulator transcription factor [Chryseobacterium sp. R2A-55]